MQTIKAGRSLPNITIKSEFYSIGVLALSLLAARTLDSCYSEALGVLDPDKVRELVRQCCCTKGMGRLVMGLLEFDVGGRFDYAEFRYLVQNRKRESGG